MHCCLLIIYLACATLIHADVRHLQNTYLPPNREINTLTREYLPPSNAVSASNQYETYAPLKIVGEPSRFVSYVAPNAPVGSSTYDVYSHSTAPVNFNPPAAASVPVPSITYQKTAPVRYTSIIQSTKPTVNQTPRYYVRNNAPAALSRPITNNQFYSSGYSAPTQYSRQLSALSAKQKYIVYTAPRRHVAATTRSLRHSAPGPYSVKYYTQRLATAPRAQVYNPRYSSPPQTNTYTAAE